MSKSTAYRLTITVPRDVKEQMDQVAEQVNWSAVATEAFRRKVAEIRGRRNKAMTKETVAERLRAAGETDPRGFEAGRARGRKWAEEQALPRHLRNIAKGVDDAFADDPEWPVRLPVKLAQMIAGEGLDFWQDAVGPVPAQLLDVEDYARGFVAGALEVWEEVQDAL